MVTTMFLFTQKGVQNSNTFDKIVKNENFQKKIFFCSFYVTLSLHTKNYGCRSSGVACGEYKDKEGGEKMTKNFQNRSTKEGPKNHHIL